MGTAHPLSLQKPFTDETDCKDGTAAMTGARADSRFYICYTSPKEGESEAPADAELLHDLLRRFAAAFSGVAQELHPDIPKA